MSDCNKEDVLKKAIGISVCTLVNYQHQGMRNIVPGPSVHKVSVYNVFKQSTGALLFRCQEQDSYSSAIEKLIVRLSYLNAFRFYRLLYKRLLKRS